MKHRQQVIGWVVLGLLATASVPALSARQSGQRGESEFGSEQKIGWSKVPAVVKQTIDREAKGGRITEIVLKTIRGKMIYEFEVQIGGDERDYSIDADGKLLGYEGPGSDYRGEEGEEANAAEENDGFEKSFSVNVSDFSTTGRNPWFILEPGYRITLKGKEDGVEEVVQITVLNETKVVDGVVTRIVEERETKNGALIEVSRNFFAIDRKTNDVYYFGETVDNYENGKVVRHEGEWMSGVNGARYGLAMPASPKVRRKYYQEIAPGSAMDRAEIKSLSATFQTPAGKFKNCLKIDETTPMEPGEHSLKIYAAGIGLIKDGGTKLVQHGFVTP